MDPDPGGPKTSGSATALLVSYNKLTTLCINSKTKVRVPAQQPIWTDLIDLVSMQEKVSPWRSLQEPRKQETEWRQDKEGSAESSLCLRTPGRGRGGGKRRGRRGGRGSRAGYKALPQPGFRWRAADKEDYQDQVRICLWKTAKEGLFWEKYRSPLASVAEPDPVSDLGFVIKTRNNLQALKMPILKYWYLF